jgi:intron-binding protein aquarius
VQNLGEAEYLVSVYQYMRLLGYPAHKISVLTTYNGQKALLRDVFERRCAQHPAFGRPAKVRWVCGCVMAWCGTCSSTCL